MNNRLVLYHGQVVLYNYSIDMLERSPEQKDPNRTGSKDLKFCYQWRQVDLRGETYDKEHWKLPEPS